MLVKICKGDGIPLINIVRKEQVDLLKSLGAEYVCNTSDDSFMDDLVNALVETGATLDSMQLEEVTTVNSRSDSSGNGNCS